MGTKQDRDALLKRASAIWFRLRHSRLVDNIVALYVVHFSNYLLPLITIPYTVRVLSPSGYGLGAFALSFAGFFGTIADYGFNLTASRAVSVNRSNRLEVSRIASQVVFTKAVLLANCAGLFWLLAWAVPKLRGNNLVMWMGFFQVAVASFSPVWLYQGLEELRFSSRVNLAARVAYVPALFLFVHRPADVWKWMVLQAVASAIVSATLWLHACLRLGVGWTSPRWTDLQTQLREGFSLFVTQAAVTLYSSGCVSILGFVTDMTVAGYYSAADRLVRTAWGLSGPILQSVYPRAARLAASSRNAALRLTRQVLVVTVGMGFVLSVGILVTAPWACPILLGSKFLRSVTITQILSPLPLMFALTNVLGVQVMIPFKHDRAVMLIVVAAGLFNVCLGALLARHWQGNGMAVSVTLSEVLVACAMYLHLAHHRLIPWRTAQPEPANV